MVIVNKIIGGRQMNIRQRRAKVRKISHQLTLLSDTISTVIIVAVFTMILALVLRSL